MTNRRSFFRQAAALVVALPFAPSVLSKIRLPRKGPAVPTNIRDCGNVRQCKVNALTQEELQRLFVNSFFFGAPLADEVLVELPLGHKFEELSYGNPRLGLYDFLQSK